VIQDEAKPVGDVASEESIAVEGDDSRRTGSKLAD